MKQSNGGVGRGCSGDKVTELRVVFLPVPGMGHLVAMVEFAKRLLYFHSDANYRLAITFVNIQFPDPSPELRSYMASVASSDNGISFLELPAVDQVPDTLAKTIEGTITAFVDLHVPLVRSTLRRLMVSSEDRPVRVAAVVVDLFCTSMVDVASELGLHSYIFFTSNAGFLSLMLQAPVIATNHLPDQDDQNHGFLSSQFHGKTVALPGLATPFPLRSMPVPLSNPYDDAFAALTLHARRFVQAKGILVNSSRELEPSTIRALEQGLCLPPSHRNPPPPIYAVGPILSLESRSSSSTATPSERHECIRWLDEQPTRSVVFLCFGSMGAFSAAQTREIAVGLEQSKERFLWVLRRRPAQSQEQQGWRPDPTDADLEQLLPDGFLERTKARGLVWPSFAPQVEILAHSAVGGFVTHCGWNSCLEGLWYGVPMAAWPLYAEQHFNAFLMVKELGVALGVSTDRKGGNTATAEEVKRAVTAVMGPDSADVRKKTEQMKDAVRSALQRGGSSFQDVHRFFHEFWLQSNN